MRILLTVCVMVLLSLSACNRSNHPQPEFDDPKIQAEIDKLKAEIREAEKDPEFNKRTAAMRESVRKNMDDIGKALLEYEKTHPAAFDEQGNPLSPGGVKPSPAGDSKSR